MNKRKSFEKNCKWSKSACVFLSDFFRKITFIQTVLLTKSTSNISSNFFYDYISFVAGIYNIMNISCATKDLKCTKRNMSEEIK